MHHSSRRDVLTACAGALFAPTARLFADDSPEKKQPYADGILKEGEPTLPDTASFTVVVLPDTQHYSEKYPATFLAQTQWIAEQRKARNIAAVLHLGDITNRSTVGEWKNASTSMKVLEDARVPFAVCPGNHDYSTGGTCVDRTTLMSAYFPVARLQQQPSYGGVYDREPTRTENSFHRFTAGGREFLVLALEFGPRADVVRWANDVAGAHAKCEVILITHALIYHDDTRYHWNKYGPKQRWNPHGYGLAKASGDDVCDGEELWDKLISKHENFILTLNGHVLEDGLGRVTTRTPGGRDIPQVLVNFQMRPHGGDGWLRLLEFKSDRSIGVIDYSPVLKKRNESAQNHFTMKAAKVYTA